MAKTVEKTTSDKKKNLVKTFVCFGMSFNVSTRQPMKVRNHFVY